MSDKIKVAEAIERQAKTYQAIIDAAAMLKEIGSLEQAKEEQIKATEAARAETEAARAELAEAKADVKAQRVKAGGVTATANFKADDIITEANQKADSILAGAKAEAAAIIDASKLEVSRASAGVHGQIEELTNRRNAMQASLTELIAQYDTKAAEVKDVEARLAKAQAQIAKLLG